MATRSRDRVTTFDRIDRNNGRFEHTYDCVGYVSRGATPETVGTTLDIYAQDGSIYHVDCTGIPIVYLNGAYCRDPVTLQSLVAVSMESFWLPSLRAAADEAYASSSKAVTYVSSFAYESCRDVVTPGYGRASSNGDVIMNPMTMVKQKVSCPLVVDQVENSVHTRKGGTTNVGSYTTATVFFDFLIVESYFGIMAENVDQLLSVLKTDLMDPENAINAAYSAMTSADLDIPVILGERRETLAHLGQTARRVAGILQAISTGNFGRIAPAAFARWRNGSSRSSSPPSDILADAWLEARYAWRPLIGDANAAMRLLSGSSSMTPRRTFRSARSSEASEFVSSSLSVTTPHGVNSYTLDGYASTSYLAKAGFLTEVSVEIDGIRALGGLNLANAAWDLVPYSFVIDHFLNIRSLIGQLGDTSAFRQLGSWATCVTHSSASGSIDVTRFDGSLGTLAFTCSTTITDRRVNTRPKFSLNLDVNLDTTFVMDLLALVWRWR